MPNYSDFREPAYREGHQIRAHHSGAIELIRIEAVRALGVHEHDWGSLTAGTASLANECTHIQLQDNEIGQYRFVAADNIWVFPKHPSSTDYYATKNQARTQGTLWAMNQWAQDRTLAPVLQEYNWAASEFWVWEDDTPRFDLLPMLSAQRPQGYVHFFGWRYAFKKLPAGTPEDPRAVDLWIDTWPTGK